jgi:hypothetical protein
VLEQLEGAEIQTYKYELFADYFQFHLLDESSDASLADSWTEVATSRMLAVAPGAVCVGTARNMTVPVCVEVFETEPDLDVASWDHVTECSLDVPSGRIVVAGCTDYFPDAARIPVPPGTYRVRVSYGSLDKLSDDGLEGDDHYRVQLWKAAFIFPRIHKQRVI